MQHFGSSVKYDAFGIVLAKNIAGFDMGAESVGQNNSHRKNLCPKHKQRVKKQFYIDGVFDAIYLYRRWFFCMT